MTRQVQAFPDGLTQLLQLKGQEPLMFPQELRGTVDVLPYLKASRRRISRITGSPISSATSFGITVPEGETWIVDSARFTFFCGQNNDVFQAQLRFNPIAGTTCILALSQSPQAQPGTTTRFFRASEAGTALFQPTQPFVAAAGDQFQANLNLFVPAGGTNPTTEFEILHSTFSG